MGHPLILSTVSKVIARYIFSLKKVINKVTGERVNAPAILITGDNESTTVLMPQWKLATIANYEAKNANGK